VALVVEGDISGAESRLKGIRMDWARAFAEVRDEIGYLLVGVVVLVLALMALCPGEVVTVREKDTEKKKDAA
jgi:hypothetical protein